MTRPDSFAPPDRPKPGPSPRKSSPGKIAPELSTWFERWRGHRGPAASELLHEFATAAVRGAAPVITGLTVPRGMMLGL